MDTLETIITGHPLLEGLNTHYFHLLKEAAFLERFGQDQVIFQEGFDADHFYLIHRGRVSLETFVPGHGIVTIQTIVAGQAFGWSSLFPPHLRDFTARAIEATEAVAFGARDLREKAEENHDFGYQLAMRAGKLMLQRLKATQLQLVEFYQGAN